MRSPAWILRVFIYTALAVVAIAVLAAATALNTRVPVVTADDIQSYQAAIDKEASGVLDTRKQALSALASKIQLSDTGGPSFPTIGTGESSLDASRTNALNALSGNIAVPAGTSEAGRPAPEVVNATLDRADALYKERNSQVTSTAVAIYQEAMTREAPFYLKYFGFRALASTVDRDVLSYRELDSLPLNDAKLTLYRTESDTNKSRLESLRAEADSRLTAQVGELNSRYGSLLASLISDAAAKWAGSGIGVTESEASAEVVSAIRERFMGFAVAAFAPPQGPPPGPLPELDNAGWLSREAEQSSEFSRESGAAGR